MVEFVKQTDIAQVPQSDWYKFNLACGHYVYSKVRLSFARPSNEHYTRCRKCKDAHTQWTAISSVEAVSNATVSDVLDGTLFIVPRGILRTDGNKSGAGGNPFPYTTAKRDY